MLVNVEPVENLSKIASEKSRLHRTKSVKLALLEEAQSHGWSVEKQYKAAIQVKKKKPYGIDIRDRIWYLLYKMDFHYMNGKEPAQLIPDAKLLCIRW